MYRLLGDNHSLDGLAFSAQVFLRALDGVRSRLAHEAGLSEVELGALARVAESSGVDVGALSEVVELRPVAVTTIVESLEAHGLVTVAPASDGGGATLTLTPAGHELIAATYEGFQRSINEAASSLDPERRLGFESGMLRMARKLDAESERYARTAAE